MAASGIPGDETRTYSTVSDTDAVIATTRSLRSDTSETVVAPDGTTTEKSVTPDTRFGMQAPLSSVKVLTPLPLERGNTRTLTRSSTTLSDVTTYVENMAVVPVTGAPADTRTTVTTVTTNGASASYLTTSPEGRSITITTSNGQLNSVSLPGQATIYYAYNGSLLSSITQDTRSTVYGYDANGNVFTTSNPLSEVTKTYRNALGQSFVKVLPTNATVQMGYNKDGEMVSVTPPTKPTHQLTPDNVGQLITYNPPDIAGITSDNSSFGHNFDGQSSTNTFPGGRQVVYTHENEGGSGTKTGRLKTIQISGGGAPTSTVTYGYRTSPNTNQVKTIATSGITLTYDYDGFLRTKESYAGQVLGSVGWDYNHFFEPSSESVNNTASISLLRDRDGIITTAGEMIITPHTQTGRRDTVDLVNLKDTYAFDTTYGELSDYFCKFGTTTQYREQVTVRDALGRIKDRTETIGTTSTNYVYEYDAEGRLTREIRKVGQGTPQTTNYTYNAGNGNRDIPGITYDDQDRITSTSGYTYTDNGELSGKPDGSSYTYDSRGSLVTYVKGTTTITYTIDPLGRRVGKTGGTYGGWKMLYRSQLQPVAMLDPVSNAVTARFVYGDLNRNVPDYMIKNGATYRIVTDHVGSVRAVIHAASGAIVQQIGYDPWGMVLNDNNPGFQPFGFAGGIYDPDTQLVRFGARDYDPSVGRWTAHDPILFQGGQENLYVYVGNDPINHMDPSGHGVWEDLGDIARQIGPLAGAIADAMAEAAGAIPGAAVGVIAGCGALISSDTGTRVLPEAATKTRDIAPTKGPKDECLEGYVICTNSKQTSWGMTACGDCLRLCQGQGGFWPDATGSGESCY